MGLDLPLPPFEANFGREACSRCGLRPRGKEALFEEVKSLSLFEYL